MIGGGRWTRDWRVVASVSFTSADIIALAARKTLENKVIVGV